MKYLIQQKATIWYETIIEADSPEEAIENIYDYEKSQNLDWWQVEDSTTMLDEFWWSDENYDEGELRKNTLDICNYCGDQPVALEYQYSCKSCTYICAGCSKITPYESGGADDMPQHCDKCWVENHRKEN